MFWVSLLAIIILVLSFLGGIKEGVVRSFFSLIGLLIAIPLAGLAYPLLENVLTFLPGTDWQNFIAFFISLGIISAIISLIFLAPRKVVEAVFGGGGPLRLIGGLLSVFGAAIGIVVFALVLGAYPVVDWLESAVASSDVVAWLVGKLGFVPYLLPEVIRQGGRNI